MQRNHWVWRAAWILALSSLILYQVRAIWNMESGHEQVRLVVVALRDLPQNTRVKKQDVALRIHRVTSNDQALEDIGVVENRYVAIQKLAAGEILRSNSIIDRPIVPPEKSAFVLAAVTAKTDAVGSTDLLPGDRIGLWAVSGEPSKVALHPIEGSWEVLATAPVGGDEKKIDTRIYLLVPKEKVSSFMAAVATSKSLLVTRGEMPDKLTPAPPAKQTGKRKLQTPPKG